MTLEQVAYELGYKPSTIKKNFKRTQEQLRKEGIILTKDRFGYYFKMPDELDYIEEEYEEKE